MNIGLDYDGTVTADPKLWADFVRMAQQAGHKVWVVTMRYPSEISSMMPYWQSVIMERQVSSLFTGRLAKRPFAERNGVKIDVWIDDHPEAVTKDGSEIWGTVLPEGQVFDPATHGTPA